MTPFRLGVSSYVPSTAPGPAAPSCTPCRSALLTGQHFWRTTGSASILQGAIWNEALPSFPPLLEQAGYHIGYAHKAWGPGTPGNAPFKDRHAFSRHGGRINQFSQNATKLVAEGRSVEEAKAELLDEVRANFRSFLEARRPGQPFCFWFGPTNVHRPWTKGSGKALWGIDPDSLAGRLPAPLPDVPEIREDFADYLGEIAAWDTAIGVILAELDAAAARDDTLVAISGDHGPPGFPHGKCNLDGGADPPADELEHDTLVTLPDVDASPTKAWLVGARKDPRWAAHFDWVFGRRPRVELYDLVRDPDETTNVAADPAYAAVASDLERRLMDELVRTGDPRVVDGGAVYETPPMAGPLTPQRTSRRSAGK